MPVRNNTNRVPYFKDCPKPLTFSPRNIIIIKRTKFACLAQPVEHAAVNRSVGGSSPSTGARKHLIKDWTRSALRATIAIPSLRSLPRYNPKQKGHCPPQNIPSKSSKHHNILCFFFPQISLAVSPFSDLTAKYSQYRFHAVFPRFFPPFKLPVSAPL